MKVAITGGTGFIGQYLIPELLKDDNIQIRCATRQKKLTGVVENESLEYVLCENTSRDLDSLIHDCDSVIHMGGAVPRKKTQAADEVFEECIGTISYVKDIFDACVRNNIKNIVYTSSIAVYGNYSLEPFVETQRCDPINVYGIGKLASEKMARYYHEQFGLNVKSLRISQVFGARKNVVRPFLKMLEENCLKREPVTIFGTGETAQDYVYVRDVCQGIVLALKHPDDFGEFNIGIGRLVSINELANAYCAGFENSAGIVNVKEGKELKIHCSLSIEKARNAWGYEPKYTLVEACKEMYEIYKKGAV